MFRYIGSHLLVVGGLDRVVAGFLQVDDGVLIVLQFVVRLADHEERHAAKRTSVIGDKSGKQDRGQDGQRILIKTEMV